MCQMYCFFIVRAAIYCFNRLLTKKLEIKKNVLSSEPWRCLFPSRWLQQGAASRDALKLDGHRDLCESWPVNTFSSLPRRSSSVLWPLWRFVSSKASIKAIWLGIDWLGSLSPTPSPFGGWAQRGRRPEPYRSQHKAPFQAVIKSAVKKYSCRGTR